MSSECVHDNPPQKTQTGGKNKPQQFNSNFIQLFRGNKNGFLIQKGGHLKLQIATMYREKRNKSAEESLRLVQLNKVYLLKD